MARSFVSADTEYLYNENPPVTAAPFSVSCRYYYITTQNNAIFSLADKDVANHYFLLYASSTDKLAWAVTAGGAIGQTSSYDFTTNADTWYHAGAIEYSNVSRACFLNSVKATSTHDRTPANIDKWGLGIRVNSNLDVPFDGKLAEFGWWNVALTDLEMDALNKGLSPLLVRPQNLIVYIPMVRDEDKDLVGGLPLSIGGTPGIGTHPDVFYPRK